MDGEAEPARLARLVDAADNGKTDGCHPGCLLQGKESGGSASDNRQKLAANRLT